MKIVQLVQKKFSLIYGIGLHQDPLNWKILLAFVDFCASLVSSCAYLINETETFLDYANSILMCTVYICGTIFFTLFVLRMQQYFGLINEAEEIIDGR